VVDLIRPFLTENNLRIVQLGLEADERIGADLDLCGQTSISQFAWLIKQSKLSLSGDTFGLHVAGAFNVPLVSLFSVSDPKVSCAFWGDKSKQKYLTPPPPWRASFNPNENPDENINRILPETVAQAILDNLGIKGTITQKTLFVGRGFKQSILELVPNFVIQNNFLPGSIINIRYDKTGSENEQIVYAQLQTRSCILITDKPLNVQVLKRLKPNLKGILYIITENNSANFARELQEVGLPFNLVSFLSEDALNNRKLELLDFPAVDQRIKHSAAPEGVDETCLFKTNRRILSNGNAYLSFAHLKAGKSVDNLSKNWDSVLNVPEFWENLDLFTLYKP